MPVLKIQDEITHYLSGLSGLAALLEDDLSNAGSALFSEYVRLVKLKADWGILDSISISDKSGMISFKDLSQLTAEKANMDAAMKKSYTPGEIRDRIIRKLDWQHSNTPEAMNIGSELRFLARRQYLTALSGSKIAKPIDMTAMLLEAGHNSDLYRIEMSGCHLPLGCVMHNEFDIYLETGKLSRKRIKPDDNGGYTVEKSLESLAAGFFGQDSNLVYHLLARQKGISPRRISRTVFAPVYHRHFRPSNSMTGIDPQTHAIYAGLCRPESALAGSIILSSHTDESTTHFSFFEDSEQGPAGKPLLSIGHKYYIADPDKAQELRQCLPDCNVIAGGTQ